MAKKELPVSPLAPAEFPTLPAITGVRLAIAAAGVKYRERADVLLALCDPGTTVAGVLTRSKTASSEVEWCREKLGKVQNPALPKALCVVSGNSNAFTGAAGKMAMMASVQALSKAAGVAEDDIYMAATGVIGQVMPSEKVVAVLENLAAQVGRADYPAAARAIMTTDTFPKLATRRTEIGGAPVTINGIVKGSGMIAPDMATMLGFIFTDAAVPAPVLQALMAEATETSFNAITVDGDTSTSDTVLAFATAKAGNADIEGLDDPAFAAFRRAFQDLCIELAQLIVKDGEGASKFIEVTVKGAEHDRAAKRIALSIANSPLVKTAIAGEDANWGRVVMAVGKAGEAAERDKLSIRFGDTVVAENGAARPDYDEAPVAAHLKGQNIKIVADVGIGRGRATVWTCDLTHGYISINADYRS